MDRWVYFRDPRPRTQSQRPTRLTNRAGVERIRLVVKLPRMLGDIVSEFLDARPDVEIVALLDDADRLETAVARHAPEVVLVSEAGLRVPAAWLDLLEAHPGLRLIAIASEGHRGALCEVLGNLPPEGLLKLVTSGAPGPTH